MMCWTQVAVLPHGSVAVGVRVIPKGTAPPGRSGAAANIPVPAPPQLSVAVGVPVCDGSVDSPHWRSRSGGQVIAGAVVSTKMMCWTQVAVLPHWSVAFHVRSIPATPVHPGGVPALVKLIVTGPPQLSVADAVPV